LNAMQNEGLIERLPDSSVHLTMAAWNRLDPPPRQTPVVDVLPLVGHKSAAEVTFQLDEIIEAHCPNCGPRRNGKARPSTSSGYAHQYDRWLLTKGTRC
jgi:hypothetical protein